MLYVGLADIHGLFLSVVVAESLLRVCLVQEVNFGGVGGQVQGRIQIGMSGCFFD